MEDKIHQLEDKFASFLAKTQSIGMTGLNKKENSTKEAMMN
jgi:hypothetical protein